MDETSYQIFPVGVVRSPLTNLESAPMQGDEGAPEAWLEINEAMLPALLEVRPGNEIFVLTWLHLADRDTLQVHPRGDPDRPLTGVFATRSPDRPNPIGLHRVRVLEVEERRLKVAPLEAINGTPVIDLKPVLGGIDER